MVAKMKDAKRTRTVEALGGAALLGEIICWDTGSSLGHRHQDVVKALREAGLDDKVAKELLVRDAFRRACKHLEGERVIDILKEDPDTLTFQFTRRQLQDTEWRYKTETLLTLDKLSGEVRCSLATLKKQAEESLEHCLETRTNNDITRMVQRLFEQQADLFSIRPAGGVYFVPQEHSAFVSRVEAFLKSLTGRVCRFPVPAGTDNGNRAVRDAIADRLKQVVEEHEQAVREFTVNSRNQSFETVAAKLNETRVKVEAYASYLMDRRQELLNAVEAAKIRLDEKVQELSQTRDESQGEVRHVLAHHLKRASSRKPLTRDRAAELVLERFPDRNPDTVHNTVKTYLSSGVLKKRMGLDVRSNEQGYWIEPERDTPDLDRPAAKSRRKAPSF